MQVILREDVSNLGRVGDVINVKDGYGRNYLIPRGLAVIATSRNVRRLDHDKRVIGQREQKLMRSAEAHKQKIEQTSLSIPKQVGEEDKLFGSVTARDIAAALKGEGLEIDRKQVQIAEPIRSLGVHQVSIRLGRGVSAELKVWVVAAD